MVYQIRYISRGCAQLLDCWRQRNPIETRSYTKMELPVLVYDDDCGVCTRAALFIDQRSAVDLVGFSELTGDIRSHLPAGFERCAHFVTAEGTYSCGEAMERAYERTGLPPSRLLPVFRLVPGYGFLRERVYRLIAGHRPLIGRLLP
jgi:predicted DCC family thiol-disulfide oxidoreductase YuxK